MIFLGCTFFCADSMSVPCTPTDVSNINYIELSNGEYDDLYMTKDTSYELTDQCQGKWDFDTILYAKFDGNGLAGNVDWSLDTVSNLLIKKRKIGDFKWLTLQNKQISSIQDSNIYGTDFTCGKSEYEYAVVPVLNGIEGNYSTAKVKCDKFFCLLIADDEEVWTTMFTDGQSTIASNVPSSAVVTMYGKYPTIVRNTNANYETVDITASFFILDKETCMWVQDDDNKMVDYVNKCKAFLNNGKTKFVRNVDGNMWLGYVTTPPTDTADGHYLNRKISFGITEVGNPESEEDLYNAGLIDVTEEWWNR